jgi:hypothetical protein
MYYRMANMDAQMHQGYTTEWKIFDSSNSKEESSGSWPTFNIQYSDFPPDENKIIKYMFNES